MTTLSSRVMAVTRLLCHIAHSQHSWWRQMVNCEGPGECFSDLVYGCIGWFSLTGMGLNRGHLLRGLCFWASETLLVNASDMIPGESTGLEASPFPLGILIMKSPSDGLWTLWHISSRNDAEGSAGSLPGILGCLCLLIRHLLSSDYGR